MHITRRRVVQSQAEASSEAKIKKPRARNIGQKQLGGQSDLDGGGVARDVPQTYYYPDHRAVSFSLPGINVLRVRYENCCLVALPAKKHLLMSLYLHSSSVR